ncbi:glutamine--fructose-6-phosphate transaminase (isomerizing) [Candidatus Peregrinibacteria bacterium CG10_big_fil_rev_8_21_14_0_10_36_19]|nr:MAG: glutamine--fructose-6-phosphate transaminase (isomerizing) [Candidatus Peregrinibacteria bacterium CG10_big_fil_rev_8_21_14_0_10_36_19]
MCGIFAYLGPKNTASEMVIEGLKRLEYRGYDSWGIASKTEQGIEIHKEVGKIGEIKPTDLNLSSSNLAIGHSRWATHGGVNKRNAHPHFSENKEIVLVHNGIFENYLEIKNHLKKIGHNFVSETDTEVIAHLIEEYSKVHTFEESVHLATKEIEGRYAIVVISKEENKIIAARKGSPLIIGVGNDPNEYYIASDIPAFLPYTKKVIYLDDNQMVTLTNEELKFIDFEKEQEIEKRIIEIDWDIESAEKGAFPHFMIKEIMEQKDTLSRAINQEQDDIKKVAKEIEKAERIYLVGCGTAGKVCMVGEYLFAKIPKIKVNFAFGSELQNFKEFITKKTLLICVSQSGETADTLEAIEIAKEKGAKVVSIVNVESSTMARASDIVLPIKAGPEKAVASTKATTSQLAILTMLAHACNGGIQNGKQLLINTASQINDMLNPRYEEYIHNLAEEIKDVESMYIIGRGSNYPIALEAAIKLQEVSYIHAEGFAAGELKHGPIALISENTPVITLAPNDELRKEIISNATEIKARGGYIIGISPTNHEVFDFWIRVPDVGHSSPIVNIIPIQILAYQLAVLRKNNPDMPRNLAKSVTVK